MAKRYSKLILLFFISILLFEACKIIKEKNISGTYSWKPFGESHSYTEIMQLYNDGTFIITSLNANISFLDYIIRCDTTKGIWQINKNSLIFTTDCKSLNANDNISQISKIEFLDSIKLKVVNFSDNSPADMAFSYFDDTGNLIIDKRTNSDGVVMLPNKKIPFSNHVGKGSFITLDPGYYYQITYFDCFPVETYAQDTFLIRNDKLVKKSNKHTIWQRSKDTPKTTSIPFTD